MKASIHFIGIGGIGVSALARFYNSRGYRVSGSDLTRSEITDALKKEGIRVFIGPHEAANISTSVSKVIYTAATRPDNPEVKKAKRIKIPTLSYAQAVGELTKKFKTIAVAGAHGKTTTTALTALALIKGGLDPTVIIGSKLREFGNRNFRLGHSRYFVIEADEYKASFLNYSPTIAVITNLDHEHLDFYKNIRNIESAFLQFLLKSDFNSWAVLNADDPRLRKIAKKLKSQREDIRIIRFSLKGPEAPKIKRALKIPGRHNISNALAAMAVARALGVPADKALTAIKQYRGAWRRFDYQGLLFGAKVFADYAHHPTEIKATLAGAKEKFPKQKLICVFQPHHYERARDLFGEFTKAFDQCDLLFLLDIYEVAGREKKRRDSKINSSKLAETIAKRGIATYYLSQPNNLKKLLKNHVKKGDILLMMGAGSIWEITKKLMRHDTK